MSNLLLYFHTLRYLRPVQIASRLRQRLPRRGARLAATPAKRSLRGNFVSPVRGEPSLLGPDLFRFLNVERRCRVAADWLPAGEAKLWIYHLHYFDDLNAIGSEDRAGWHRALVKRWIAENPPGAGDGWEPYPVSRRLVNWVKWAARGNELSADAQASLAVQAAWLERRLEYSVLGNHLFTNAKALVHAGLFFQGRDAERWFSHGMSIIATELAEQVLPDGGQFELSPMYHAAALEDMLDLINIVTAYERAVPQEWTVVIDRMRDWLDTMSHPDGEISFFNDAALAVAPTFRELESYAARLHLKEHTHTDDALRVLAQSGYVRATAGLACLLCDCAPVGPDYLPGHAHADTLSFELSLAGCRVFVNSGTSVYGTGAERQRQRGTAAHNTVVVDGQDSSEVWAGFRVARRARAQLHAARCVDHGALIEASHDGYRRLPGRVEHRRRWLLIPGSLQIEDRLTGQVEFAEARFHLHPQVRAEVSGGEVILTLPRGLTARMTFDSAASVEATASTWHPRFGLDVPNTCIAVRLDGLSLVTTVHWSGEP